MRADPMAIIVFAFERIDTWVIRAAIALPLVTLGGLLLFHLVTFLSRKLASRREAVRESPEPPSVLAKAAEVKPPTPEIINNPERLQLACDALVEALAEKYLELAECLMRKGDQQQALLVLEKIVRNCPATRQALIAQDRIRQVGMADQQVRPC